MKEIHGAMRSWVYGVRQEPKKQVRKVFSMSPAITTKNNGVGSVIKPKKSFHFLYDSGGVGTEGTDYYPKH